MNDERENKMVKPGGGKGWQPNQGVRPNRSANEPTPPPPPSRGEED